MADLSGRSDLFGLTPEQINDVVSRRNQADNMARQIIGMVLNQKNQAADRLQRGRQLDLTERGQDAVQSRFDVTSGLEREKFDAAQTERDRMLEAAQALSGVKRDDPDLARKLVEAGAEGLASALYGNSGNIPALNLADRRAREEAKRKSNIVERRLALDKVRFNDRVAPLLIEELNELDDSGEFYYFDYNLRNEAKSVHLPSLPGSPTPEQIRGIAALKDKDIDEVISEFEKKAKELSKSGR